MGGAGVTQVDILAELAIGAHGCPARGPLDAPASLAHVADVRQWIAEWEAPSKAGTAPTPANLRAAAKARRELAAAGFAVEPT